MGPAPPSLTLPHKGGGDSEPYRGEHLGERPHAAVVFRDQIGDFLVATPLMRGLRERFPGLVLDYFGGERTREIEEASPLVDARHSLFGGKGGPRGLRAFLAARRQATGPYSLAVNLESDPLAAQACGLVGARFVCGPWLDPASGAMVPPPSEGIDALWHDEWNRSDLLADYPILSSPFIGEIFCRLCRVETAYGVTEAPVQAPPIATPPVLISAGASRSAKLWPVDHWLHVLAWLRAARIEVGLLGASSPAQGTVYHSADADAALLAHGAIDLRGHLSLPEVAGALAAARAFITVDNGLMHLAAAVGAPTIALFGASPRRLWAPPAASVRILEPTAPCDLCERNRFRNNACLIPIHQCMLSIEQDRVVAEIWNVLQGTS